MASFSNLPHALVKILKNLPFITVAYSGGLDSRFLCHAAKMCGSRVRAVHVRGPHIFGAETIFARSWAQKYHIEYEEIFLDVLGDANIRENSKQRCYYCKLRLFKSVSLPHTDVLCDGTNGEDLNCFRPGLAAVHEIGVKSPLAEAALSKDEIRNLAQRVGLECPEQKARSCMLTRFAYGVLPKLGQLKQIESVETALEKLLPDSMAFRLRFLPEPVLHLNMRPKGCEADIREILEKNGLEAKVAVVPRISGFFDRPAA